jgi:transcriptional regulator with XRE-family HTH domain
MSIDVTRARTNSLAEQVAEEIRVLLARRRIKQSHLARELGVNDQWVSVRLRGVTPLDLLDLERIAAVLGVPVTELLPRSAAETPARSAAGAGSRITDR